MAQLAKSSKKDDNFGANDDDWEVYKKINKDHGDSDSEEELERLTQVWPLCNSFVTCFSTVDRLFFGHLENNSRSRKNSSNFLTKTQASLLKTQ